MDLQFLPVFIYLIIAFEPPVLAAAMDPQLSPRAVQLLG